MATLELARLSEIDPADIIALMNHPGVRRHMPLSQDGFGPADCASFVAAKQAMWDEHGYGPWAFLIDGAFAGWGGLQPEGDDADLGLVLHPAYWGYGKMIFDRIMAWAFDEMSFDSVTILLPPSRGSARATRRLGFAPDGEITLGGELFLRYRLRR
jgi:[ribosomal protein S5]-alanine N-acetyltransferase